MNRELEGGKGIAVGGRTYGDFTNQGKYATTFTSYDFAQSYNSNYFGFITSSGTSSFSNGSSYSMELEIDEGTIPMNTNGDYFVYLWVKNGSYFYPDNLICAIQVRNGVLKYAPGSVPANVSDTNKYRNYYDEILFKEVGKYNIQINASTGMQIDSTYNRAKQANLASGDAIETVIYNAADGYYFPDTYAVATVNGISVQRISDTQIRISGNLTADTVINLPAASRKQNTPVHTCTKSTWITNATHHWRLSCTDPNCPESNARAAAITDHSQHVYTDGHDPECNVCGYTRTITDERPATGDITNIPLWTMLFLAGIALMYVQLTQRKREQF